MTYFESIVKPLGSRFLQTWSNVAVSVQSNADSRMTKPFLNYPGMYSFKGELSFVPCEMPGDLEKAIAAFVDYYNYRRYHEGLVDVTPYDVYTGKHLEIIQRRKEAKSKTLQVRKDYNRVAREQDSDL